MGDKVKEGSPIADARGQRRRNGAEPAPAGAVAESVPAAESKDVAPSRSRADRASEPPASPQATRRPPTFRPRRRRVRARRRRTRRPACAAWRASWASIWRRVSGSGRKGRITKEDVQKAKDAPAAPARRRGRVRAGVSADGLDLAPWPKVNFERYGEIERQPLTRIQKISGPNLARNWVMIPHVTHHDEADITELEAFRKRTNGEQTEAKVTMVALLAKAVVASLKAFPVVNSSLDGDDLVLKRYYNIGFAADTPNGLVVPVIKDADKKGILEIAQRPDVAVRRRRATGKLGRRRHAGRDVHDLLAGRDRRHGRSRRSSTRPRWRSSASRASSMKPVWNGSRVRAAADGAAVAVLRPPRDRRRARRALRRAPGQPALRPAKGAALMEVKVPDIGDFDAVPVIEILVAPGDEVAVEDPLVVLESDKATMEVRRRRRARSASSRSPSATRSPRAP